VADFTAFFGRPPDQADAEDLRRYQVHMRSQGASAKAARPGKRSPRFRRVPFVRDVALDPGRATEPRIAVPHMLPSACLTASAPAISRISWLNPTPHMIAVYASPWSSPSTPQHSLLGGRYPLPGPDFHRMERASFPGAPDISSPPCLLRLLPAGAVAGWGFHPLESAAFSRRTGHATSDTDTRSKCRVDYRFWAATRLTLQQDGELTTVVVVEVRHASQSEPKPNCLLPSDVLWVGTVRSASAMTIRSAASEQPLEKPSTEWPTRIASSTRASLSPSNLKSVQRVDPRMRSLRLPF